MTQEQLAAHFGVSPRTVSRWENGNDLPDVDILIGLADLYEVGIRELIDGERKSGNVDKETKETVLKAAEYMNMETERYLLLWTGAFLWLMASLISHTGFDHNAVLNAVSSFAEGAALGMILCGIVFTSRYGQRIKAFKRHLLQNQ